MAMNRVQFQPGLSMAKFCGPVQESWSIRIRGSLKEAFEFWL